MNLTFDGFDDEDGDSIHVEIRTQPIDDAHSLERAFAKLWPLIAQTNEQVDYRIELATVRDLAHRRTHRPASTEREHGMWSLHYRPTTETSDGLHVGSDTRKQQTTRKNQK